MPPQRSRAYEYAALGASNSPVANPCSLGKIIKKKKKFQ